VTLAPPTFGAFGGDILVGNFGDGRINAFDPVTGEFQGELSGPGGGPIAIEGLWGLRFAPATPGATPNTLFFTPASTTRPTGCSERSRRTDSGAHTKMLWVRHVRRAPAADAMSRCIRAA
jgi:hypothetical protein